MPTRTLLPLLSLLLLAVMMGCPAFGPNGSIPIAIHRDMTEYYSHPRCHMPTDKWLEICDNHNGRKTQPTCPVDCRPQPLDP